MIEYKNSSGVLVFNDKGELALQLRTASDDSFPSHWDCSAGGGIDEGEDAKTATERELREELGVEAKIEFISKEHYRYPAWTPGVSREVDLYIYKTHNNGPFKPDPKEIDKVEFFSLAKIKEMIESGQKFHPEFILSWNKGVIQKAAGN